jgi:hypothetical protein
MPEEDKSAEDVSDAASVEMSKKILAPMPRESFADYFARLYEDRGSDTPDDQPGSSPAGLRRSSIGSVRSDFADFQNEAWSSPASGSMPSFAPPMSLPPVIPETTTIDPALLTTAPGSPRTPVRRLSDPDKRKRTAEGESAPELNPRKRRRVGERETAAIDDRLRVRGEALGLIAADHPLAMAFVQRRYHPLLVDDAKSQEEASECSPSDLRALSQEPTGFNGNASAIRNNRKLDCRSRLGRNGRE